MRLPLRIAVLGSTGSIGRQTLDVALRHPEHVTVVSLSANTNAELLARQAAAHGVSHVALADTAAAAAMAASSPSVRVDVGNPAIEDLARADDVDVVVNALVGAAGLRVTMAALRSGKLLALANKESLVVGGELVMDLAAPGQLVPVDSEHSAIHQCLCGEDPRDAARIWLTASGGPFRGWTRERLADVTASQALAHPTWNMGPKITIDSATLMNKGLEVIEAHYLFDTPYERITVVVHPQSCVHSMVELADGSVIAHLGATDMRIPIQYALSQPRRWPAPTTPVDFRTLGSLDFGAPDTETFGCLGLAFEAGRIGGTSPIVLNAANEIGVAAFLEGRCGFLDIERVVETALSAHDPHRVESVDHIEAVDAETRILATQTLLG